jgi:hypothetical protein
MQLGVLVLVGILLGFFVQLVDRVAHLFAPIR